MDGREALRFAGACIELTPPPGLPMGGYGARGDHVSSGTHDPLEAVLLTLRDGRPAGEQVTWVVLDAVAVDGDLARMAAEVVGQALRVPLESVLVSATHTHSGPAGWTHRTHPASRDRADEALRMELVRRLGEVAARVASMELRPVHPLVADATAPGVGSNRADPAGPHDASVGCLALIDTAGGVAGLLVDHGCHATVLGHDNLRWSADWPGAARRTLAAAVAGRGPFGNGEDRASGSLSRGSVAEGAPGPSPIVAVVQGAAGDVSPRFTRRAQSFAEVDRLGGLLAAHALRAVLAARPTPGPDPRLTVRHGIVTLPTRPLPSPAEARRLAAEAEAAWHTIAEREGPGPLERIARTRHEGATLLADLAEIGLAPALDLPLSVVALGDDAWLHLPVELFASLGLEIRAGSPFARTRVIGYTNGYFGYVADEQAHAAGAYEAAASLFDAHAGRQLIEGSIDLLRRTRAETVSRGHEGGAGEPVGRATGRGDAA